MTEAQGIQPAPQPQGASIIPEAEQFAYRATDIPPGSLAAQSGDVFPALGRAACTVRINTATEPPP